MPEKQQNNIGKRKKLMTNLRKYSSYIDQYIYCKLNSISYLFHKLTMILYYFNSLILRYIYIYVCVCVCVWPHRRVMIERNSLSVDDNIYAPPWGLSTLAKEVSAVARIMQSSSKELSTLVADRV